MKYPKLSATVRDVLELTRRVFMMLHATDLSLHTDFCSRGNKRERNAESGHIVRSERPGAVRAGRPSLRAPQSFLNGKGEREEPASSRACQRRLACVWRGDIVP